MGEMKETPIFVTSVFHTHVDLDLNSLYKTIKTIESQSERKQRSGSADSYQSDFFINTYDNELVEKLFTETIIPNANNIIKFWWNYTKPVNQIEYWYNINYPNSYNIAHNHIGSMLSGVFYIKVPKNSGNIYFMRSEQESNELSRYIDPNNTTHYTHCRYWLEAFEGKLILFPSYLSHYVEQNLSDDERISLSFNLMG